MAGASYRVEFSPGAVRRFKKLPREVQAALKPCIDALSENPRPVGVDRLSARGSLYRIREGDYRVVYEIQDSVLVVLVVNVGHRRDIYRRLR